MDIKQIAECCIKQHHEQVIGKQKEAISELRKYVAEMEELTVNMSLPQVATHKILKLKNSNEELKKQLAAEILTAQISYLDLSEDKLYQEVCYLRDIVESANQQLEIEQGLRKQYQVALDASEEIYLKCIRSINSEFDVQNILGCRPITYVEDPASKDEIINERRKGIEVIVNNIKALKAQAQRKDDLLRTYEDDARKLCESRDESKKQSKQIVDLEFELEAYKDEVNYLQESLRKSHSACADMKRLKFSVDQKKLFSTDYEKGVRKLVRDRISHNFKVKKVNNVTVK